MGSHYFHPQAPVVLLPIKFATPFAEIDADLILDTGATYTTVSQQIVESIGLDTTRPIGIRETILANGTLVRKPFIRLPQITVLGYTLREIEVCFVDFGDSGVEGVLGIDTLRQFKLTIDFPNGLLLLEKP